MSNAATTSSRFSFRVSMYCASRLLIVNGVAVIPVTGSLVVPAGALRWRFSRSSGPGGQGVNTADSRVQLALDLGMTTALSDAQRELVLDRLSGRLSGTVLTVSAAEHRS